MILSSSIFGINLVDIVGGIIASFLVILIYEALKLIYLNIKLFHLNGIYNHYDNEGNLRQFGKGLISHSKIRVSFCDPFLLRIDSVDYKSGIPKAWKGRYRLDSSLKSATGYYYYEDNKSFGDHVLQFCDRKTINVHGTNTSNQLGNSIVRIWKKVDK